MPVQTTECRVAAPSPETVSVILGAVLFAATAPAAEVECETVKAMLGLVTLENGAVVRVAGYHRPGNDGGGRFVYDAKCQDEPDGGTVLKPKTLPGRFRRRVNTCDLPLSEWFGAHGDGDSAQPHADQDAINACLRRFRRVRLLAKTYGVRGTPAHYNPAVTHFAIGLASDYLIEGTHRSVTKIRLLDGTNPRGSAPRHNYFQVMGNARFHTPADNVIVRDMTIDCNFDGQNKHTTIHAIRVRGGAALLERLNLRGFGTGRHPKTGSSRECFVVSQTLVYKHPTGSRQAATFRQLDFAAPGHNGDVGGRVAEITLMALGGADNFGNRSWIMPKGRDPDFDPANDGENENNWWPSRGGLVEDCMFHDMEYTPNTQQSFLNGITYGNCIGMRVRNNTARNFEGAGVFVMSWHNRDTVIEKNRFINVRVGLALHITGSKGKPVQAPLHEKVLFQDNTILLCEPMEARYPPKGVHLYGGDLGTGIRLKEITIRRNLIKGRSFINAAGKRIFPVGIGVQILHPNYEGLTFADNLIEVPDFSQSPYVPQVPYSMAMTFFPLARWGRDKASRAVRYAGNRNRAGDVLHPILQDWHFKNKPTWGK